MVGKLTKGQLLTLLVVLAMMRASNALALNTTELATQAFSCTQCLNWRVTGVCFWLKCSGISCEIETSVRVGHNAPDVVISAYNGSSTWEELDSIGGATDGTMSVGQDQSTTNFKNVDVVGHPAVTILEQMSSTGYYCPSQTTSLYPHYFSGRDAGIGWSNNIIETVLTIPNYFERVGNLGKVYPRMGWTVQANDVKAAALTAARAGHFVTRTWQPHIYSPITGDCSNGNMRCWSPPELDADDENTGVFQMVSPEVESSAQAMSEVDDSWTSGKYPLNQQYAWTLWRPYQCCEVKGAFLYSVVYEE